ncbi:Putative fluoride ion transporter CrcB [Bacillus sp. THAF10]|uniref:fluoride efflux transporter FluC n=1 Tax=Bacillus sp. THAF10 TaxID=2587848 RepID=UPI001267DE6C|nr:CrcB family protein [Bacillus sp. THAF10]QFT87916.1 Putative fluoride ion transporter CrcB [Bacillus sp. THAF10]
MFVNLLSIGIGGALGTFFRFLLNNYTLHVGFPVGTIVENLLGSFLLGAISGWVLTNKMAEWLRLGIGVGLCGGFTTMSTLAADSLFLHTHSSLFNTLLYLLLSLFGGISLAFIGFLLGDKWGRVQGKVESK